VVPMVKPEKWIKSLCWLQPIKQTKKPNN